MEELSLPEATNVLRNLCRQRDHVSVRKVSNSLTTLQNVAKENGLTEELLNLCSDLISKKCHTMSLMLRILKVMLPRNTVPDNVIRCVLKWIHRYYRDCNHAVVCALQWVAGLLEFGLANEKPVNDYYYMFHELLEWSSSQKIACWLVVRLTRPDDVDRSMVLKLIHNKKVSKPIQDIILWCYKTFKPECVPEAVAARNIKSTLKLSQYYKHCFGLAHQRCDGRLTSIKQTECDVIWNVPEKKRQRTENLIPAVEYILFGSTLYREEKTSILRINNWEQLSSLGRQIEMPAKAVSLLQNPIGLHVIACGNDILQARFSYTLFHLLQNVIIDRLIKVPLEKQESLLDKVCEFQEYIQQGVPVVSRFVAIYIVCWDGFTFLSQLMRLLPWVTFSSFSELRTYYLVPLYYVFISSNLMVKCSILRALLQLIRNLMVQTSIVQEKVFIHSPRLDNEEAILYELIKYVESLCVLGLNFEPESMLLMHEVLRLYEFLLDVEERAGLHVRCILPPVAVYFSLFSRNYCNVERVCGLLLKYDASFSMQKSLQLQVPESAKLVKKYSCDYLNFLWLKQAFSGRKNGYIFRGINPDIFYEIENIDEVFNVRNCVPLVYLYHKYNDTEDGIEKFIREFKKIAPNIYSFIKHNVQKSERSVN